MDITEQPPASLQPEATTLAGIISFATFSPSCQFSFSLRGDSDVPDRNNFQFEHNLRVGEGTHHLSNNYRPFDQSLILKKAQRYTFLVVVQYATTLHQTIPRPFRTVWDRTDVGLFASMSWRWPFSANRGLDPSTMVKSPPARRQRDNLQEPRAGCLRRTCAFARRSTCCGPHSAAAGRCSTSVAH